ncbi:MAG: cyclic nucleotide-binding domain-containing protein [Actinomycetota bacterium]|nr:cyclic nucleotide-binding domain-containing protein [Actinomycetota bacterium]
MTSRRVYVEHLRNSAAFGGFTRKELERVASVGIEADLPAGTVLMHQGHTGHDAFIVLDGEVLVRRNGRRVATLGAGDIVGELALLDDGPRSATVECLSDCKLLLFTNREFTAVLDDVPALSRKLLASLANRLRTLDSALMG